MSVNRRMPFSTNRWVLPWNNTIKCNTKYGTEHISLGEQEAKRSNVSWNLIKKAFKEGPWSERWAYRISSICVERLNEPCKQENTLLWWTEWEHSNESSVVSHVPLSYCRHRDKWYPRRRRGKIKVPARICHEISNGHSKSLVILRKAKRPSCARMPTRQELWAVGCKGRTQSALAWLVRRRKDLGSLSNLPSFLNAAHCVNRTSQQATRRPLWITSYIRKRIRKCKRGLTL